VAALLAGPEERLSSIQLVSRNQDTDMTFL
jgi:hypothetical protein